MDDLAILLNSAAVPVWLALHEHVRRLGTRWEKVLIVGETGTGKSLVAAALHTVSARTGPLVRYALTSDSELVEAELRGHERGAFTGAEHSRPGFVELAHGGTLHLDEIHLAALRILPLLLDIMDFQPLRRLGNERAIRFDTRLVLSTNLEPSDLLRLPGWRRDHVSRIGYCVLRLPPLRAYRVCIVPIARTLYLAARTRIGLGHEATMTERLERRLARYEWPGNLRQLKSVLEAMAILAPEGQPADLDDLPDLDLYERPAESSAPTLATTSLVASVGGNIAEAARQEGCTRATIYKRLRRELAAGG